MACDCQSKPGCWITQKHYLSCYQTALSNSEKVFNFQRENTTQKSTHLRVSFVCLSLVQDQVKALLIRPGDSTIIGTYYAPLSRSKGCTLVTVWLADSHTCASLSGCNRPI